MAQIDPDSVLDENVPDLCDSLNSEPRGTIRKREAKETKKAQEMLQSLKSIKVKRHA